MLEIPGGSFALPRFIFRFVLEIMGLWHYFGMLLGRVFVLLGAP